MSTQWDTVALALVDALRATTGYRHPESTSGTAEGIPVYFGPEYGLTDERLFTFLSIGWPGDPDDPILASGQITQVPGPMSPGRAREETGLIACRAVYQSGDANDATMRAGLQACRAIVGTVETLLRTDPLIGLPQPPMKWAFVTDAAPRLDLAGGVLVEIDFTVTYEARIV